MMEKTKQYTHIIWDWNGTLFNDVAWGVEVVNKMLEKRSLKIFNNIDEYRDVFGFPIKDYYIDVGFDFEKEPFEQLAVEFIELYHFNKSGNCQLNQGGEAVLAVINQKGINQVILSASKKENLLLQLEEFDISHYFNEILGISDIYAKSKIDIGLDYINRNNITKGLLIGDTIHDYEVATALGMDCILVTTGHQSKKRLLKCGVPVIECLTQIVEYLD